MTVEVVTMMMMMMMMGHLHALLHPHHTKMNRKNPNNWTFLCGGFSPFMHLGKVTLRKWVSIPNVVCPLFGSRLPWRTQPVSASVLFRSRSWPPYANPSGASERRCRMRCFGAYKWSRVDHPREHGPLEVFSWDQNSSFLWTIASKYVAYIICYIKGLLIMYV